MIKNAMEFFVTYFVIPYSIVLYVGCTSFMLWDFFQTWKKSRQEKKDAKVAAPQANDQTGKGGKL